MLRLTEIERKANELTFAQVEEALLSGRYTHSHCLWLVPNHKPKALVSKANTPVEICLNCGMVYYDAAVLKNIEQRFFAIYQNEHEPDCYVWIPEAVYA